MLVQIVLETINLNQMMGRKFPYVKYFSVFQLNKFRKLKGEHGRKPPLMCDNYRPIQPLNDRTVYSVTNSMCNETDEENASSNYNGKHKQAL